MIDFDQNETDPWPQDVNIAMLQRREQRQRSIRFLMMFLLMLTLMDGEEAQRRQSRENYNLRHRSTPVKPKISATVYAARRSQDQKVESLLQGHARYLHLREKNNHDDIDQEIRHWVDQTFNLRKTKESKRNEDPNETPDPRAETVVYHYPWNATGSFQGTWERLASHPGQTFLATAKEQLQSSTNNSIDNASTVSSLEEMEPQMLDELEQRGETLGVYLLPGQTELFLPNASSTAGTAVGRSLQQQSAFLRGPPQTATFQDSIEEFQSSFTQSFGRVALKLNTHAVPAMKELSVVDGHLWLCQSNASFCSKGRGLQFRVRGVVVHALGIVSLVSTTSLARGALIIAHDSYIGGRNETLVKSPFLVNAVPKELQSRPDFFHVPGSEEESAPGNMTNLTLLLSSQNSSLYTDQESRMANSIFPYPFVYDDEELSVSRSLDPPERETFYTKNCEFEIKLDVQEEIYTIGQWRALMLRHTKAIKKYGKAVFDSMGNTVKESKAGENRGERNNKSRELSKGKTRPPNEPLIMAMNGTISSPNCNFSATINTTAIRTDWKRTTGKATTYCFYMILTCFIQIILLLRQLLHTQAQAAATRVSLLCIGWQTVLDAILCLVHIFFSLTMAPVFTAFACVAFFKLLIFCVIEMKYMAIIIQARNAGSGGNTMEHLRRQIAVLHLQFYVALMGTLVALFYAWDMNQTFFMLVLYSFWVPQIVRNVITEAKRPLHHYYVFGMSITRLVAPLYMFALNDNFLAEVFPESITNTFMCELIGIWVFIQAAILELQGRYGARCMIPAQFLPPKFDYSRPIPPSLLPTDINSESPSESLRMERESGNEVRNSVVSRESSPRRPTGARNRMKGSRGNRNEASMTTETVSTASSRVTPNFDCVICYNEIDIRDRTAYMLAPCDHLFHRDCLIQWMEVKMECPVCRKELPSI